MREIALRRPKMRLVDDVAPFLFDICKQIKKYMTDHPRVKENKLWCRQEDVKSCVFVNYLENGRKD